MKIWTTTKTQRGFELVRFTDHGDNPCELQQSSAIGGYDDAMDRPGTSYVWLGIDQQGCRMHLDREAVTQLVMHLSCWLEYGSFIAPQPVIDPLELLDQAQIAQAELEERIEQMNEVFGEIRRTVQGTPFDPDPIEEPNPDSPWLPVGLLQKIDAVMIKEFRK